MLAAVTGADTLRIEQVQPYSEDYKACVAEAREDWQCGARPALVNLPESLDGYDEIYLGYPNYCGTMPMAVYTFLEHYDFTGKTIRPFCTHEGSGLSDTESDIRRAAPGAAVTKGSPSTAATSPRPKAPSPAGSGRGNKPIPGKIKRTAQGTTVQFFLFMHKFLLAKSLLILILL